jgi:hypothetical protein
MEFVRPDVYRRIAQEAWNKDRDFYTLTLDDVNSVPGLNPKIDKTDPIVECVSNWVRRTHLTTEMENPSFNYSFSVTEDPNSYQAMQEEYDLGRLRRYLLIIAEPPETPAPPDAFVSYVKRGRTFYIDGNDIISQKNFALLSQFMTMEAIPPTTPPLTPTISVGGS